MGKFVDLTNRRFGMLLVLKRVESGKYNETLWLCRCGCGKEKIINGASLKGGHTKSCGCIKRSKLLNKKFGRLTVIEYKGINRHRQTMWLCICDCGNENIINGSILISGKVVSCGCYNNELASILGKSKFLDLTGRRFGKLKAIEKLGKNNEGNYLWRCECDCGNDSITTSSSLVQGSCVSCGCLRESYIAFELKKYYIEFYGAIKEYKILRNPKTNFFLPYDLYISSKNIYIEFQGEQHFVKHYLYHPTDEDFKYQKYKDGVKRRFAKRNGIFIALDLRKFDTVEKAKKYISGFL